MPQDSYVHVLREDPKKPGLLFAGTDKGIIFSIDDGATWRELKLNFPTVPVHDLLVKNNDLVIGTHGRSFWIFDDIGAIRQMTPEIAKSDFHLFTPEPAMRYRYAVPFHGQGIGANPPPGALISYFLKEKPKEAITLDVLDPQGKLVMHIKSKPEKKDKKPEKPGGAPDPFASKGDSDDDDEGGDDPDEEDGGYKKPVLPAKAGVNRFGWDLHYKGAEKIKGAKVDAGVPYIGPLVNPGTYTLKLRVGGKEQTASLVVEPDPRVQIAAADLDAQLKFSLQIRDDLDNLAKAVNGIRTLKKQLLAQHELLKGQAKADGVNSSAKELYKKLDELEEKLHNPRAKVTYDILAQPGGAKLYSQLAYIYAIVTDGDGAPTQGVRDVYAEQAKELQSLTGDYQNVVKGELARLNEAAKSAAIPNIILPATEAAKKP
jgi:hypothetical protein